jgi:hypothetical protein
MSNAEFVRGLKPLPFETTTFEQAISLRPGNEGKSFEAFLPKDWLTTNYTFDFSHQKYRAGLIELQLCARRFPYNADTGCDERVFPTSIPDSQTARCNPSPNAIFISRAWGCVDSCCQRFEDWQQSFHGPSRLADER